MSTKPNRIYLFSLSESVAAITAKNHLCIVNPVGSGRTIGLSAAYISFTCVAAGVLTTPMRGFRCTYTSGGTLQAASAIAKFNNNHPDSVAQMYTGNPTVTLGAAVLNSPPGVEKRSGSVHEASAQGAAIILLPGEAFVMRQGVSTVDLFWNISLTWTERP